jgi:hypothetical protein
MKDPDRLVDMNEGGEAGLLRYARTEQPTADDLSRTLAALGAGSAVAATGASGAAAVAVAAKWVAVGALGAVVTVGGVMSVKHLGRAEAPAATVSASKVAPVAVPALAQSTSLPEPMPVATPSTAIRPPVVGVVAPMPAVTEPQLEQPGYSIGPEIALLDQVRAAIGAGRPHDALALLEQYDSRFEHGVLGPEARYMRVEALVQLGDRAAARGAAKTLLERDPASPHAMRVRELFSDAGAEP